MGEEMREIKFRAWDSQAKRMLEVVTLSFMKMTGSLTHVTTWDYRDIDELTKINFPDKINLMQHTGLKDKNGKEIYEGDIILVKPTMIGDCIGKIRWSEKSFRFLFDNGTNWGLNDIPPTSNHAIEIIGNIYENSELMK